MGHPLFQVDAFAKAPFSGNPAAVCILNGPVEDAWMQKLAAEMNLSETAFLFREADGFGLRWFTPILEVDLCGHATLAAAHVLWETANLPKEETARFHTKSGLLTAVLKDDWIEMDFPAQAVKPIEPPAGLCSALGAEGVFHGTDGTDCLVEFVLEADLKKLKPDFTALRGFPFRGIVVTAPAENPDFDFVSRFFAPSVGIDEDPVTGSAHCTLGPFWSKRLGKTQLMAFQASKRGGVLKVTVKNNRVLLSGQAVTVFSGSLAQGE